jgi:hypothetical protein
MLESILAVVKVTVPISELQPVMFLEETAIAILSVNISVIVVVMHLKIALPVSYWH